MMSKINITVFEASCVNLILQGREKSVEQIIGAFNDVDGRFEPLQELIKISPYSLEGMLLAFAIKEMRETSLDFTIWPHNVLLNSSKTIQNIEEFTLLLRAIEQTVEWEDTFTCVQQLVQNLPIKAIEDIVTNADQLGRIRVLVLAYIFGVVAGGEARHTIDLETLLEQIKEELENIRTEKVYFSLSVSWGKESENRRDIFPETLYMLSLFEVLKVLPSEQFSKDYKHFRTIAFELFYRETDTFSRWDRGDLYRFFWAYKQTLSAIDNELVDSWRSLMQDIEGKWIE